MAIATVGAIMCSAPTRTFAAIEIVVTSGSTTDYFYTTNDNSFATGTFTIGGYKSQIQTTTTSYPGNPGNEGSISTTVNIGDVTNNSHTLQTTVLLIKAISGVTTDANGQVTSSITPLKIGTAALERWTAPATTPVDVSSGASFAQTQSTKAGLNTASTFYDSPGAAVGPGTFVVGSTQTYNNTSLTSFANMSESNTGTYTLGQMMVLSKVNVGASKFNYGATSAVDATIQTVPEPSSLVLSGLGGLGLIGYGLRRRKASGA